MSRVDREISTAAWLVAYGAERPQPSGAPRAAERPTTDEHALAGPSRRQLSLLAAPATWSPSVAETAGFRIVFDGLLDNRAELCERFADRLPREFSDADLVGQAYHCWGENALCRLKGGFALVIADSARDRLLCARDPFRHAPIILR